MPRAYTVIRYGGVDRLAAVLDRARSTATLRVLGERGHVLCERLVVAAYRTALPSVGATR